MYYGDEAGVCGWTDPDNRRTYPWGHEDLELLEFYREAICLHKQNPVLRKGSYIPLMAGEDLVCYGRFNEKDAIVTIINTSVAEQKINIPVNRLIGKDSVLWERLIETNNDFYNCGRVIFDSENGELNIAVKAGSAVVLRNKTV